MESGSSISIIVERQSIKFYNSENIKAWFCLSPGDR